MTDDTKPDYVWLDLPDPPADRPYIYTNMVMSADGKTLRDVTPGDFESPAFSLSGGGFALSPDGKELVFASAAFRPRMRSGVVDGLYLAGSSVHLGGGIPVCIGSGLIVADLVDEDQPHSAVAARRRSAPSWSVSRKRSSSSPKPTSG